MPSRRLVILFAALAGSTVAALAAPTGAIAQTTEPPVKVVATFSILADLIREVGGARVAVSSLVGPNGDAHEFQPSPADAKTLADANLILVNGLGLEGWFDRLVKASGTKARVVTATTGVRPLPGEPEGSSGHRHKYDPHAWQSVANARIYVANIRDALVKADPADRTLFEENATRYLKTLEGLEAEVRSAVATIPADHRKVITTHDAFGYFAAAYGMRFIAPQGVSTETEASAQDVARIIRQIKAQKIPAVFIENISDSRLMEQIARESGARIGGKLYSDALSEPTGPAATYVLMMRNNIGAFKAALAPGV